MVKRTLSCISISIVALSVVSAQTKPENTAVDSGGTDAAWTQHVVQSYLHLQDQQQATLRAIEQTRQEAAATARAVEEARLQAESAAKRSAEALESRLGQIEQSMLTQRAREIDELQRSHRFTLITLGVLGAAGFFGVLFFAVFLLRAMQRRVDCITSPAFGVAGSATVTTALGEGETQLMPANPAVQSSARLQSAVARLEQRLNELETGVPAAGEIGGSEGPTDERDQVELERIARVALLLGKGQTLLNLRKPEDALACLDEAITLDSNNAECFVRKGAALEHLGRLDEAIECYDRAIAIDQSMTMAYLSKGGVFNRLERYNEALQCYEQALRAEKKSSVA
jgi:tetratricopeptide (TPR) repeat protein